MPAKERVVKITDKKYESFPRTLVSGVSLPRLLIGSNWMLGYSHRTAAASAYIKSRFETPRDMFPILDAFMKYGIDAIMAPMHAPVIYDAVKYAEDKLGRNIILIDTPPLNVDNNAQARQEAEQVIKNSAARGADFCLIHHSSAEQLVNKNKRIIDRLPDYLSMIREHGMIPGLSAHMPELILYSDLNRYDVQTYVQIFNCAGFLMQIEIEIVAGIIHNAKKPVMTIKPLAAGRVTPYVGLTFNWNAIRDCDMITVGVTSEREVYEDVEISLAALERRFPRMEGRGSPAKQDVLDSKK